MFPGKIKVMFLMMVAVFAVSIGEALLSKGMKESQLISGGFWAQVRNVILNGHVIGGTALMAAYFGLYMLALRWADFSFVLPLTALSYLLGALLARYYLGETVTPVRWVGALVITVGVIIVGVGDQGAAHTP